MILLKWSKERWHRLEKVVTTSSSITANTLRFGARQALKKAIKVSWSGWGDGSRLTEGVSQSQIERRSCLYRQ